MSRTPYLDLNIPDKSSKGFVVTDVFEPNFTKLDQEAERVNLRKMSTEDNIEELKKSTRYKVGDVVEVLGYYSAGDGAGHPRQKKPVGYNGADAVIGADGSIWGIIHSGEINISWLGAKGDRVTDVSQYCKFHPNTTYVLPKDSYIRNSVDVPPNVVLKCENIIVDPINSNSIFNLSKNTSIEFDRIERGNNYNGFVFDITNTKKKEILERFSFTEVDPANLNINIKNSVLITPNFEEKQGYLIKVKIMPNGGGMYGLFLDNLVGRHATSGLVKIETTKGNAEDWLTGITFSDINIDRQHKFLIDMSESEITTEHFVFNNFQSQAYPLYTQQNFMLLKNVIGVRFNNVKAWDYAPLFETKKPFNFVNCRNVFFDDRELSGFTLVNVDSTTNLCDTNISDYVMPGGCRFLEDFTGVDETVVLTKKNLKNLPNGEYTLKYETTFKKISLEVIKNPILKIVQNFEYNNSIVSVTGINTNNEVVNRVVIINENDTDINSTLKVSDWTQGYDKTLSYQGLFMRVNTFANRPLISDVPNGYLHINTNPVELHYAINGAYHVFRPTSSLYELDTPYHASNMQKLGILGSYHNYLTDLHEYEKQQNTQSDTGVMNLNVIQPPAIPTKVEEYAKEYNLI